MRDDRMSPDGVVTGRDRVDRPHAGTGIPSPGGATAESAPNDSAATQRSTFSAVGVERVERRYRDAYRAANSVELVGAIIKTLAIILGVAVGGALFYLGLQTGQWRYGLGLPSMYGARSLTDVAVAAIAGLMAAVPLYIAGIMKCAHAQLMRASLDCAVHTSPFLSDKQRARIMGL